MTTTTSTITITEPTEQYNLKIVGKPGDWQIIGEGYSSDHQPTRKQAFVSWLTTVKCRQQNSKNGNH